MARRRNSVLDFVQAFNQTFDTVNKVGKDFEIAKLVADKGTAVYNPDQVEQRDVIANARDEQGNPMYTVGTTPDGQTQVTANTPAEDGSAPKPFTVAANGTQYLGKTYDRPLSDMDKASARSMAMSGIMAKYGDAEGAMRFQDSALRMQRDAKQEGQNDQRFSWDKARTEQDLSDKQALRNVMRVPSVQSDGQPGTPGDQDGKQPDDLHAYVQNTAPVVIKTLLAQGKIDEAKRYSDFVDTEDGKRYARAWVTGLRKHAIGDHAGAIKSFEKLYNDQMYNDGQTVKIDPLDGGKQYQVELLGADGKSVGRQTLDPATLANQAAMMLDPVRAVEFQAQQVGKRDAEAATLDRQLKLEQLRQETAGMREDRRDARLVTSLQTRAAASGRGPSLAQQRSNAEIDAARDQVAGLDPAEIRRRTAKTTDTGRENPDYDPSLAHAATLAGRRKVGDDEVFDGRPGSPTPKTSTPNHDRQDVAKRFRTDKSMDSYRLGNDTPNGIEVLDRAGKVIGHYH